MSTRGRNLDLDAARAEAERAHVAADPKSRAVYEATCATLPGGTTRMVLFEPPSPPPHWTVATAPA